MSEIDGAGLTSLRARLAGRVVTSEDADYDAVRAECVWNGDINRRPLAIARCESAADVAAVIRFGRGTGHELSVRGGGHSGAGACISDGGIMIDLGPLHDVHVDPASKTVTCGGGTRWAGLDAATQEHGLAVPGGVISHTGVAGLTLGGGIGWLTRKAGLTCDNLESAEIVTADGEVLRVSARQHPDLFWAIRGGGGNFGVVTKFEFRACGEGPLVQLALLSYDLEHGGEAYRAARDLISSLPDDIGVILLGGNAPPAPFVPEEYQGTPGYAVLLVGHGSAEEHQRATDAIRRAVPPLFELVTPIPYAQLQQMFDDTVPWGIRNYDKALNLAELSDAAIDVITGNFPRKASPMSIMPIYVLGGEFARKPEAETAFGGSRQTRFIVTMVAVAPTAELLDADRAWARATWTELVPHAEGVASYVNFMGEYEEDRVKTSYGSKYERLAKIKAAYDPDNVFHLNANIQPGNG
jgi:hypothetical protein